MRSRKCREGGEAGEEECKKARKKRGRRKGWMMVPDARVACTAMNPDDLPISFTIPMATIIKGRTG